MTPVDRAETEPTVKMVVLCSMVGLLVGLATATIMVSVRAGHEEGEIDGHRASSAHPRLVTKQPTARSHDALQCICRR